MKPSYPNEKNKTKQNTELGTNLSIDMPQN